MNNQGIPGKSLPSNINKTGKNCDGTAQDSVNINISVNNNGYINTVNGISCNDINPE